MLIHPAKQRLRALRPDHAFFIAIDSDGCVFDTMEVKHKECFCPVTIRHFSLQAASRYARQAWEFVNLYSRQRGTNRFPALVSVLDMLREHDAVRSRGVRVDALPALRAWILAEAELGNPALCRAAQGSDELRRILRWSEDINRAVEEMVHGVQPFPGVAETLREASSGADLIVSSGTPVEALEREWQEHAISPFVKAIAGQECGRKAEHLRLAASGRYAPEHMLMIGDAFGDLEAARAVGAWFFPILPGREEESWQRFLEEGLDRFLTGAFGGAYQQALVKELCAVLPEQFSWPSVTAPVPP